MQHHFFPGFADRAFLGDHRPGAELEGDFADFRIVDVVFPVFQRPNAAGQNDRRFRQAVAVHQPPQFGNAVIGRFRFGRILGVGKAFVSAGQPRVFVNDAAQKFGKIGIGTFPQDVEGAGGRDDRVIVDAEF